MLDLFLLRTNDCLIPQFHRNCFSNQSCCYRYCQFRQGSLAGERLHYLVNNSICFGTHFFVVGILNRMGNKNPLCIQHPQGTRLSFRRIHKL